MLRLYDQINTLHLLPSRIAIETPVSHDGTVVKKKRTSKQNGLVRCGTFRFRLSGHGQLTVLLGTEDANFKKRVTTRADSANLSHSWG